MGKILFILFFVGFLKPAEAHWGPLWRLQTRNLSNRSICGTIISNFNNPWFQPEKLYYDWISYVEKIGKSLDKNIPRIQNIRFRSVNHRHLLDFEVTPLKSIFPNFDPKSQIIIGMRGNYNPHIYTIVNGYRYDAAEVQSHRTTSLERGWVFLIKNIPEDTINKLTSALKVGVSLQDITCYSALFKFLEDFGNIKFISEYPALPIFPLEYILGLFDRELHLNGKPLPIEYLNLDGPSFSDGLKYLVDMHAQTISNEWESRLAEFALAAHSSEDWRKFDYRKWMF